MSDREFGTTDIRRSDCIDRRLALIGAATSILGLPVLVVASPALATPTVDPLAFINAIYRRAVKEGAGNFIWDDAKSRPQYMTKSLVALFAKTDAATPKGDEGPLDFDFPTDTNGLTLGSFKAALEKREAEKAVVAVTIGYKEKDTDAKTPHVLHYDLLLEDGHWRIDDTRGKDWALRQILEQFLTDVKKS